MARRTLRTLLGLAALTLAGPTIGCDLYDQSLPPKIDAGPDTGPDAETDGGMGDAASVDGGADGSDPDGAAMAARIERR